MMNLTVKAIKFKLLLGFISLLLLSGCKKSYHEIYDFEYKKVYKRSIGKEASFFCFTRPTRYPNEKEGYNFLEKEPYRFIYSVNFKSHEKHGKPKNIDFLEGTVNIHKKNGSVSTFDMTSVDYDTEESKQTNIYHSRYDPEWRNLNIMPSNSDVFKDFIDKNLIHAEVEKVVCDLKFIGLYEDGKEKLYEAERILNPYYKIQSQSFLNAI